MLSTSALLRTHSFPPVKRDTLETLQANLGYLCNQQCVHCHVNASPQRTELMTRDTCEQILAYLQNSPSKTLDLTGGAPELNPYFRYMSSAARQMGIHVIDRCNLTVLSLPEQADLADFLAEHQVEIIASLPCYLEENVDKQRGKQTFQHSIAGLRKLNALGYGRGNPNLPLNLVFNPQGPTLPPAQAALEQDYKAFLFEHYGVTFDKLYTICNMPIQRFGSMLASTGQFAPYMQLLREAHCDKNLDTLMCRSLISVNWQGYVYDCDFNQMLELPLHLHHTSNRQHISELIGVNLENNLIMVTDHCYGCTAGQGSSCVGALS